MRELITEIFARHLANPDLDTHADAVALQLEGPAKSCSPPTDLRCSRWSFPAATSARWRCMALATTWRSAGATPRYMSLNAFIEEGLEVALLDRIVASLAKTARELDVRIVAGDTKVVRRGEGGGLYLATTGIGVRPKGVRLGMDLIRAGDALLVSGSLGDHGIAVMLAREQFGLRGDLRSDAASVLPLTKAALQFPGLRFMRDPTRGGIATVSHEIIQGTGLGVRLRESDMPVRDPVISVCEQLGYDPLLSGQRRPGGGGGCGRAGIRIAGSVARATRRR